MSPVDEAQPLSAEEIAAIRERAYVIAGSTFSAGAFSRLDIRRLLATIAERDKRIAELEARLAEWIDTERVSS